MGFERVIRRYSAYYPGWCQAFGEHRADAPAAGRLRWLYAEDRVGLILEPALRKRLARLLLGRGREPSNLVLGDSFLEVAGQRMTVPAGLNMGGLDALLDLLRREGDAHLFLSYHFCYAPGTRIITFALKGPLMLLYREVSPLHLTVAGE